MSIKKPSETKNKKKTRIRIALGNATWGSEGQTKKDVATQQLQTLLENDLAYVKQGPEKDKVLLDTARLYQSGESEAMLGEILREHPAWRSKISIHTKVLPGAPHPLNREGIHTALQASLKALGVDKVDIYYLHQPDIKTPYEETFGSLNELYKAGKFVELGLSNFASWDVVRIHALCKAKGWVVPTVYQGLYNAINRTIEPELMPALRSCGMRSYWYNPLAAGLLTGKYKGFDETLTKGRFSSEFDVGSDSKNPLKGRIHLIYRERYWKKKLFDSLEVIRHTCEVEKISMGDVAIRWLTHHSVLNGNYHDGLIFGASSLDHVKANLHAYSGGELPESIVKALDEAWQVNASEAESYMRGYGAKPGGSELFLSKY